MDLSKYRKELNERRKNLKAKIAKLESEMESLLLVEDRLASD